LEPLFSAEVLLDVSKLCDELVSSGAGSTLQDMLHALASKEANWLENLWDGGVYLDSPVPLPIHYSYFLRLADADSSPRPPPLNQAAAICRAATTAAVLARGMLEFREVLNSERLAPDTDRGMPVDMNQYGRLFGHARIALEGGDRNQCFNPAPAGLERLHFRTDYLPPVRHVLAICGGCFYTLEVLTGEGAPLPAAELARRMAMLCAASINSDSSAAPTSPASFTSLPRSQWAPLRKQLAAASPRNTNNLHLVDSSIWVLNLDIACYGAGEGASSDSSAHEAALTREGALCLYGSGDGRDRWFDKHQLIVTGDGSAGVLMEHGPGDGLTALRLLNSMKATQELASSAVDAGSPRMNIAQASTAVVTPIPPATELRVDEAALLQDVQKALSAGDLAGGSSRLSRAEGVTLLQWDMGPPLAAAAVAASDRLREEASRLALQALDVEGLGAAGIKQLGLPPDAFVQMAMQLAHHRLFGFPAPTYESTTLRGFLHGRTETTRSCSSASQAFVKVFSALPVAADAAARAEVRELLAQACAAHVEYARAAKAGHGVDRHLLGLKVMALQKRAETGGAFPMPALFEHPAFEASRRWRLSTSNCGDDSTALFGFGPVVSDGFGIGYVIGTHASTFNITAWRGNEPGTDPVVFGQSLREAMHDMKTLMAEAPRCSPRSREHSSSPPQGALARDATSTAAAAADRHDLR
jgi:carnitine O-acetyltransferase